MRLVDADKLIEREKYYAEKYKGDFGEIVASHVIEILDSTPTVDAIPIDFITEFKEDYCNAKSDKCDIGIANALVELMLCWEDEQEGIEWRNDHERIPSKQQSVEAIPIEFIRKWVLAQGYGRQSGWFITLRNLEKLVKDWEADNETD